MQSVFSKNQVGFKVDDIVYLSEKEVNIINSKQGYIKKDYYKGIGNGPFKVLSVEQSENFSAHSQVVIIQTPVGSKKISGLFLRK